MLHIIRSLFRSFAADVPWLLRCTNVKRRSDLRQIQSLRQKVLCRRNVPFDSISLVVGCSCSILFRLGLPIRGARGNCERSRRPLGVRYRHLHKIQNCRRIFSVASSECFQPFTASFICQYEDVGHEYLTKKNGKISIANNRRWLPHTHTQQTEQKPQ